MSTSLIITKFWKIYRDS